jgi:hypothetical protein
MDVSAATWGENSKNVLTEKQWAIIYAALLEMPAGGITDSLAGTEFAPISEEEVDVVFALARIGAGMVMPS